jgi:hypothetical protein
MFLGAVRDSDGVPLADAEVDARPQRGGSVVRNEDFKSSTTSAPDGTYKLTALLPFGKYDLAGSKLGYGWGYVEYEFSRWQPGMEVRIDLTLTSLPVISGTVRAPSGQVLAGASVRITLRRQTRDGQELTYLTETTNEVGRFSIALEDEGDVLLGVCHPLYCTLNKTLGSSERIGRGLPLDLAFEKVREGQYFQGRIVSSDGMSIVPRQVTLARAIDRLDDPERSMAVPVDNDGKFEIILERDARYWITIEAKGHKSLVHKNVSADTISTLNFQLQAQRR